MGCACGKEGSCGCQAPIEILLRDEAGVAHAFYITDKLNVNNQEYVFAVNAEDTMQYTLLRATYDAQGRQQLSNIVDEEEWAAIEESFASLEH
jgi:uncharacterized protein YrzB (UPF0473 family)